MEDGCLPTMSYWYGKVLGIYLKMAKQTQDVWLDIQWYYRRVDLEDEDVDLAACVGEYELVLSDHKSAVDMHCVEAHAKIVRYDEGDLSQPQIPTATLYHRWNNTQVATSCSCNSCDLTFSSPNHLQRYCRSCRRWFNEACIAALGHRMDSSIKVRLPPPYDAIKFDEEFLALLTTPIRRGGHCGVVGNGILVIQVRALMEQAMKLGKLPDGWMDDIQPTVLTSTQESVRRYSCPMCTGMVI
ncbi:hypothetical protein P692DRAFT_20761930 [Suillus brevipes Sb2]|nr:hypothetical protein P692DRAFT_20761930 [Suillus brevipes Sb2]